MTFDALLEDTLRRVVREEIKRALGDRPSASTEDRRVAPAEAAAAAGVSLTTLRHWESEGRLRRYGEGRTVRYSLAEVLAIVPEKRTAALDAEDVAEKIYRRNHG